MIKLGRIGWADLNHKRKAKREPEVYDVLLVVLVLSVVLLLAGGVYHICKAVGDSTHHGAGSAVNLRGEAKYREHRAALEK
jgi:hypothetical protein